MRRKLIVFLLFVSLLISQAVIYTPRQSAAENTELLDMAAMLPESDVVVTMDFNRTLNIALPSLLNQDAKKVEHLKNLMQTVENQIGISPYEIRQIAAGFKVPGNESTDFVADSEFAVIVRTENSNANLLDTWSKRVDAIMAFKDEQSPSRKYIDDFKMYRSFKFEKTTPEKIASASQKFQASLKKSQEIAAALESLPKLPADAKAINNLKAKNKDIAETVNNFLVILKAETDMKPFRETTAKLINRWNAVTIDEAQRTAKLAEILKESKDISPAYQQKYDNAQKIETLFDLIEPATDDAQQSTDGNLNDRIDSQLDKTATSLKSLPAAKLKKTATLNSLSKALDSLSEALHNNLQSLNAQNAAMPENPEAATPEKTKSKGFYELLKQAEHEENINGKRMISIDFDQLDEPQPDQKLAAGEPPKKKVIPDLAVGFLDDKTMVIGFEKTITPLLKRDANYKNQKAVEMLSSLQNSLFAFALNSNLVKKFTSDAAKRDKKPANQDIFDSLVLSSFTKDINIYGSVNYDSPNTTNDITMSLGFFKENVGEIILPETTKISTESEPVFDDTFEIAGYQVGKDIFYDLLNSFKAVQASLTFKFEKKKVIGLVDSAPQIIDKVIANNSAQKRGSVKSLRTKPNKLESFQDLLTTPQFYIDLAGLLNGKN